jgi:hypothetical protein
MQLGMDEGPRPAERRRIARFVTDWFLQGLATETGQAG